MPEHAHLLIWPLAGNYSISEILSSIKQSVAKKAIPFVRRSAPAFLSRMKDCQPNGDLHYRFWQRGGGYDRNIIEPEAAHQQIQYIHNNPVRRGLCDKPESWLWSSAADYTGVRAGPLTIDRQSLPTLNLARYACHGSSMELACRNQFIMPTPSRGHGTPAIAPQHKHSLYNNCLL
jgi:putative transposase